MFDTEIRDPIETLEHLKNLDAYEETLRSLRDTKRGVEGAYAAGVINRVTYDNYLRLCAAFGIS